MRTRLIAVFIVCGFSASCLAQQRTDPPNARPADGELLERWLDNMIIDHRFTAEEVRLATALSLEAADVAIRARSQQVPKQTEIRLLPYPGGRHPRIGFLEGAINPQRETKVSVFPPWKNGGYVVIDVPEAIFSNLGLTYLAHTHIPTIWDKQGVELPQLEWTQTDEGLTVKRSLPNGIDFESEVVKAKTGVRMELRLKNGTKQPLSQMRVQVCAMLKGAPGFNKQEEPSKVVRGSFVAIQGADTDRWIITAWQPLHRVWTNPPVPCVHSDPMFPDCAVGETVTVKGGLWFYEGAQVQREMERLQQTLDSP